MSAQDWSDFVWVFYADRIRRPRGSFGEGYNDVLFTRDAGRVRHVNELR